MNRARPRAIITSGGSRLTDARALTVIPSGRSPSRVVTMVTPVANWPMAVRKSAFGTVTRSGYAGGRAPAPLAPVRPSPRPGTARPSGPSRRAAHRRTIAAMNDQTAAASPATRIERDSMGEMEVPADAMYGASTQRAVLNFPISGQRMPRRFLRALALVKIAAAETNAGLGLLEAARAAAIADAAREVAGGRWDEHFPIDVYQTGSGTSTNTNMNEVISHLASARLGGARVHP